MKRVKIVMGMMLLGSVAFAQTQADLKNMDAFQPSSACSAALKEKGYEWRGGVIYTSNELSRKWHGLSFADSASTAPLFAAVKDEFAKQGRTLVLLPMAPRQLYADRPVSFGPTATSDLADYEKFIASLRAQNIKVVDPTKILTSFDADFFRQETHWRSEGAQKIANEVAKVTGNAFKSPVVPFTTRKTETVSYSKDTLLYKVVHDSCGFDLPAEQAEQSRPPMTRRAATPSITASRRTRTATAGA